MLQYSSVQPFTSNVFPGVSFKLRKMSESRRAILRVSTASANAEIRELLTEVRKLKEQPEETRDTSRVIALNEQIQTVIMEQLNPAWITWGVKSITGMMLDPGEQEEESIAVENAGRWPSELYAEVLDAVKASSTMTDEEIKNFVLPSISGAQTDGKNQSTGAQSASDVDTSAPATAESTSQTK